MLLLKRRREEKVRSDKRKKYIPKYRDEMVKEKLNEEIDEFLELYYKNILDLSIEKNEIVSETEEIQDIEKKSENEGFENDETTYVSKVTLHFLPKDNEKFDFLLHELNYQFHIFRKELKRYDKSLEDYDFDSVYEKFQLVKKLHEYWIPCYIFSFR